MLITALLSGIASTLLQAAFSRLPEFLEILIGSTIAQAVVAPFGAIAIAVSTSGSARPTATAATPVEA